MTPETPHTETLPDTHPHAPAKAQRRETASTEVPAACASCGTVRVGPYCHACGEKRLDRHDYAFLHWVEHGVDAFTHLDVKVFRGLWSLLRRPGAMAADVLAGRRVRWSRPFQTFVVANLVFYLGVSQLGLSFFDAPLSVQTEGSVYKRPLRAFAEAKADRLGLSVEAYAERYDALSHTLAKTLVVLLVPVVALLLAALFRRHRRYLLEHATVATLALSQFMLVSLAALAVPVVLVRALRLNVGSGDDVLVPIVVIVNAALFFSAFRRVYPGGRAATAAKAVGFTFLLLVSIVFLYRPALFLIVNALT